MSFGRRLLGQVAVSASDPQDTTTGACDVARVEFEAVLRFQSGAFS